MITARKNWKEVLDSLFPDAVKVGYYTPGIDLVIPMKKELDEYDERHHKLPNLIFLQNHGLIVSSDHFSDIAELNESVLQKIETFLDIPSSEYKLTTAISKLLRHADPEHHMIAFLSEDSVVNKMDRSLFFKRPFTPDILVFCGMEPLKIDSLTDPEPVIAYTKKCHGLPRIIIFKDHIFCIALNVKKAREVEEVLKFHLTVLSLNQETEVNFLSGDELIYLSNWEAEKYRQNI